MSRDGLEKGRPASRRFDIEAQNYEKPLEVTGYLEAIEVLRSPLFGAVLHPGTESIMGGTVGKLDEPQHGPRRRALNRLVRRDGHRWFRDEVVVPTIAKVIEDLAARPDPDGVVRADLVKLGKLVNLQLGAALVGVDGTYTGQHADELIDVSNQLIKAIAFQFLFEDRKHEVSDAEQGMLTYRDSLYGPALEAHEIMLAKYHAGGSAAEQLPRDMLSLVADRVDPAWEDFGQGLRDALVLFAGPLDTSVNMNTFAVHELSRWFDVHPADRVRSTDKDFLFRALSETMRIHANKFLERRALVDLALSRGTTFKAGQVAKVMTELASRDKSVFGEDAEEFDPHRTTIPGTYPYGLAFGTGPHMCLALPLVMGSEGIDGAGVHFLERLFAAGIEPDTGGQPIRSTRDIRSNVFETYPVVFARLGPSAHNQAPSRDS